MRKARAELKNMIDTGRRLAAEALHAADAESFTRRVDEWRDYTSRWLDQNIGGHVADEYKVAVVPTRGYAWSSSYWEQYYPARKQDIEAKIQLLEAIGRKLPDWAESGAAASAGRSAASAGSSAESGKRPARIASRPRRDAVMVIYGHDQEANTAMFSWLRAIGLQPKEWSQLVQLSGSASPYTGQVLELAFKNVQAVVALFTPDEHVRARDAQPAAGGTWRLQARPNVLIEAGMALATHPDRTVIICLGPQELPSDLAGRHHIQLDDTPKPLNDIANRLQGAGCAVDLTGADWLDPKIFPRRDSIPARPEHI